MSRPARSTLSAALLAALRDHGAREIFGIPGDFALGFFDAVEVRTGKVSRFYLALDQGMVMAALGNALAGDCCSATCQLELDCEVENNDTSVKSLVSATFPDLAIATAGTLRESDPCLSGGVVTLHLGNQVAEPHLSGGSGARLRDRTTAPHRSWYRPARQGSAYPTE